MEKNSKSKIYFNIETKSGLETKNGKSGKSNHWFN